MEAATEESFTLQRLGYEPLPYFSDGDGDSVLKYKFLERFRFVVEPLADMKLHALSSSSSSSSDYYKFKVCSVAGERLLPLPLPLRQCVMVIVMVTVLVMSVCVCVCGAESSEAAGSCQEGVYSSSASSVVNFDCRPQRSLFSLTVERLSRGPAAATATVTVFEGTGPRLAPTRPDLTTRRDVAPVSVSQGCVCT